MNVVELVIYIYCPWKTWGGGVCGTGKRDEYLPTRGTSPYNPVIERPRFLYWSRSPTQSRPPTQVHHTCWTDSQVVVTKLEVQLLTRDWKRTGGGTWEQEREGPVSTHDGQSRP